MTCSSVVSSRSPSNAISTGAVAEGAALVHAAAARGGGDLALVGQLHLAAHGQLQVVDAVEGARREHADGGAGGEALLDRQVGLVVVDHQPAHVVVGQHLVGHPGDVAPEAALLGLFEQRFRLHRDLVGPMRSPSGVVEVSTSEVGCGSDLGVDALVRAGDEGVALLDLRVDAAVAAGPVGMLAEQADATGDEDLHPYSLEIFIRNLQRRRRWTPHILHTIFGRSNAGDVGLRTG